MRAYVLRTTEAVASVASFVVDNVSGIFPVLKRAGFLTVIFCVLFSVSVLAVASCDKSSAGLTSSAPPQSISGSTPPAHDGDSTGTVNDSPENDAERQVETVTLYDTLRTVDAYTVTGDSGASVDSLKRALKDSLAASYKGRFTSDVATGDAARVRDIAYDMDSQTLSWTYANDGDYDLDGSVGVPDITPIAENYLATVEYSEETYDDGRPIPAGDPLTVDGSINWYKAFLDTDRGGDIGISDITAIADNYLNEVSGYAVFVENDPTLPVDDWRKIADIDLDDAKSNLPADIDFPVPFTQMVTETDGHFALVRPYDSTGKLGDASDIVVLSNTVIPQAYAVVPADGITGDVTTFVAVTTGLMPFDWYWNFGAAAFPSTSSKENPTVILGNPGEYDCSVRVTNPYGSAYFVFTITVDEEPVPPPPPVTAFAIPGAYPEQYGDAPFTPTLSCNKSYSTAGSIVLYEWDFESDGVIDVTQEFPYHVTHEYPAGEYTASLYVTDETDYRASATLFLVALSNETQWETIRKVTTSSNFSKNSIRAFLNPQNAGLPAISYVIGTKVYYQWENTPDSWLTDSYEPTTNISPVEFSNPVMTPNGSVYWCGAYIGSFTNMSHICYILRSSIGEWSDLTYIDTNIGNFEPELAVAVDPSGYPAFLYRTGSTRDILRYTSWDEEREYWKIEDTGLSINSPPLDFQFIDGNPAFITNYGNLVYYTKAETGWESSFVSVGSTEYNTSTTLSVRASKIRIFAHYYGFSTYTQESDEYWSVKSFSDERMDRTIGESTIAGCYFLTAYRWQYEPFDQIRFNLCEIGDNIDNSGELLWDSGIILPGVKLEVVSRPILSLNGDAYTLVHGESEDGGNAISLLTSNLMLD